MLSLIYGNAFDSVQRRLTVYLLHGIAKRTQKAARRI
jgi:phage-related protein